MEKSLRGNRGREATGKTAVFGLLKREGKVFVQVVERCLKEELMPIVQGKILEGSTVYADGWKAYGGLILNGHDPYHIFHSENEFSRGNNHINGIESFWFFAERRLSKFNGLKDHAFFLHIKECEFRFNYRYTNLYKLLLAHFRNFPL